MAGKKEETFVCAKCGKEKKKTEGSFVLEGTTFCCKKCCGDVTKGDHKKKAEAICEFC
jgi:hypothetical protein